ncbi:hypothetical protein ABZW11_14005 [Nonomuraea sp. NPDC004580]|uniref:hypothetical protein n=1 Tax=Nonomuraea sp. NPDC004580 TaxID=3154552 RepID=UPI0033A03CB8
MGLPVGGGIITGRPLGGGGTGCPPDGSALGAAPTDSPVGGGRNCGSPTCAFCSSDVASCSGVTSCPGAAVT